VGIPLNIDYQQILLHLFNFAILAGGLHFLLYRPVKSFMEKREAHYREMDAHANESAAQADALRKEYEGRLERAEAEIAEKRAGAARQAEAAAARQLQEAQAQAEKIISSAQHAAELEHDRILSKAREEVVGLVLSATEKVLLEQSVSVAYDQFLSAAEEEESHD